MLFRKHQIGTELVQTVQHQHAARLRCPRHSAVRALGCEPCFRHDAAHVLDITSLEGRGKATLVSF